MTTPVFDAAQTARVTPFAELVDALRTAALDADAGRIESPARLVVPLNEGGVMLSMPASAADLAIHKLVTVCPRNRGGDLPTIQGQVSVVDPATGAPLFALDGPTVTGRRTAAVTLLALRTFVAAAPRDVLLIGTGTQAAHHVEALAALFPGVRVRVKARAPAQAAAFCARLRAVLPTLEPLGGDTLPETLDAVITATTSATPVYDDAARAGRLVVGVGAFARRGRSRRADDRGQRALRRRSGGRAPRGGRPDRRGRRLGARALACRRAARHRVDTRLQRVARTGRARVLQERRLRGMGSRRVPRRTRSHFTHSSVYLSAGPIRRRHTSHVCAPSTIRSAAGFCARRRLV